jgi:hypothetical protein
LTAPQQAAINEIATHSCHNFSEQSMGNSRFSVAKSRLKPQPKNDEMRSIALALGVDDPDPQILELLKSDRAVAKELGKYAELVRARFDAAYPGQTRENTFSNGDWEEAGYVGIAGINRILGLKRS